MPTAPTEETLYLIDGYGALFRAFYAIRHPLYSPVTGEPTHAILVFAQMLLKLYSTLRPDYVVVAWDAPGGTFRDALFAEYGRIAGELAGESADRTTPPPAEAPLVAPPLPDETPPHETPAPAYKGTRRQTPDSLHEQTPRVLQLLEIFGIPVIGAPGLEADDVIATLTMRALATAEHPGLRVRIATRDKDMEQLIGERVTLFDIHTGAETGPTALWEKRGITPRQVVDFLALTGDAVDNIPGVAGIGPKTAAKLLQQFGSLDGILSAAQDAPANGKVWENLTQARPYLPVSRRLVTLETRADLAFTLEQARARPIPAEALLEFCDTLGFVSLKKTVASSAGLASSCP